VRGATDYVLSYVLCPRVQYIIMDLPAGTLIQDLSYFKYFDFVDDGRVGVRTTSLSETMI
jgi:hypothetical protein